MVKCKFCSDPEYTHFCSEECKIKFKNREWLENKPQKEKPKPDSRRFAYGATFTGFSRLKRFNACRG